MSTESYNLVKDATGEIVGSIIGDLTLDTNLLTNNTPSGYTYYLGQATDSAETLYYPAGTRTTRPLLDSINSWNVTSITANGTDLATFGSSIPNPSTVVVAFNSITTTTQQVLQSSDITDGTFSLSSTLAGEYNVSIVSFPYQQYNQSIIAS